MLNVDDILKLHAGMVVRWHEQAVDNPFAGMLELVCRQHGFNFLLWHEEDVARSLDVGNDRIAAAKRNIDRYNQQRNDAIERLDDTITELLQQQKTAALPDALLNTETIGSVIDRLSVLSLRIYHMQEQTERADATSDHIAKARSKLALCIEQRGDLAQSLRELIDGVLAGRKRHKTYRQMKMYNDPTLNPYLYKR
jgi:DNA repair exonuclease SbcCD ATPase subunit